MQSFRQSLRGEYVQAEQGAPACLSEKWVINAKGCGMMG